MDKRIGSSRYRFYLPHGWPALAQAQEPDTAEPVVQVDEPQTHHAKRVLRLQEGAEVEVFDGRGSSGVGKIIGWGGSFRGAMQVRIIHSQQAPRPKPRLIVASAVPKGSHAQEMVNQLSQVGVDAWQPMHTARSVVEPGEGKLDRFSRVAIESARQCGRSYLMEIMPPRDFQSVLKSPGPVKLIAAGEGGPLPALASGSGLEELWVLIGPEGGWTDQEMDQARAMGLGCWCMGPNVLRIETAAALAGGLLRYLFGTNPQ